jgi:hypothetical protein
MAKENKDKDSAPKKDVKKDTKKDSTPKVTPYKDKNQNDIKSKALNLLKKHPQITNNARGLFRNENGKTIVEEIVYRGDPKTCDIIMPRNQNDLTEEDLRSLSLHASSIINKNIEKYDPILAAEDALTMSIGSKDNGKYGGKIDASTFQLIINNMMSSKTASDNSTEVEAPKPKKNSEESEEAPEELTGIERGNANVSNKIKELKERETETNAKAKARAKARAEERALRKEKETEPSETEPSIDVPEEDTMDKEQLKKEKEALQRKLAAISELIGEDDKKEEVEASQGAGDVEEDQATVEDKNNPAEPDKSASEEDDEDSDTAKNPITASLDLIAGELEKQNDPELFKMAYQLDQISDILEGKKEAATFESDPDEKFMKTFFKGGLVEGDSDEAYMKEFNTDVSTEVNKVKYMNKGKEASTKLPYQKLA